MKIHSKNWSYHSLRLSLIPDSRTKFPVDLATGDLLLAAKNDADAADSCRPYRKKRYEAVGTDRRVAL